MSGEGYLGFRPGTAWSTVGGSWDSVGDLGEGEGVRMGHAPNWVYTEN